jgi:hypothetical protein
VIACVESADAMWGRVLWAAQDRRTRAGFAAAATQSTILLLSDAKVLVLHAVAPDKMRMYSITFAKK